jgi:hypothetical protein
VTARCHNIIEKGNEHQEQQETACVTDQVQRAMGVNDVERDVGERATLFVGLELAEYVDRAAGVDQNNRLKL